MVGGSGKGGKEGMQGREEGEADEKKKMVSRVKVRERRKGDCTHVPEKAANL